MKSSQFSTPLKIVATILLPIYLVVFHTEQIAHADPVSPNPSALSPNSSFITMNAVDSFQTDLFTGRASTQVPIFVPPGRKGMAPSVGLSYNSAGGNGWVGLGWSLDLGVIQRSTKKGVPKYDTTDTYEVSFQGVESELVSIGNNSYRLKDEALFLRIEYNPASDYWTLWDKSGTKYQFGLDPQSRDGIASGTFA